jgi:hypothetical protein
MPTNMQRGHRMKKKVYCEAHARTTGQPCQATALANGRCRNHGGLSTGPRTFAGRRAVAEAARQRMASGQLKKALDGFFAWLDSGQKGKPIKSRRKPF